MSLSKDQCRASFSVFGDNHPAKDACIQFNKKTPINDIAKEIRPQLDPIFSGLKEILADFREGLDILKRRMDQIESDEAEKRFLTPRLSSAMLFDNSEFEIGHKKDKPKPEAHNSWIDFAQHLAGDSATKRREDTKNQPINQIYKKI